MSSDEQPDKEEAFDDDINFFPCSCQYQICRFCWHRLRTDENGLCPACRQPYPEDPVNFQPLSSEEIQRIRTEKKQKIQQQKTKLSECRKHLSAYRVLQKNLVYVVGLSHRMADADLLKKTEFFGKFGRILKIAVGTAQNLNNTNNTLPTSYTAYVTYIKTDDALRAIQAVNNLVVDGRLVKASLGTTKYCSNFLKGQSCHKQECMYLHEVADEELSFTKEDMHLGKHTECEKKLHDQMNQMNTAQNHSHSANLNGSSSNEVKNGRDRKDSQSDSFDKPPPGFQKLDSQSLTERSSFEAQESSSKSDNAWNERDCKTSYYSPVFDEPVHSNGGSQSSPVNFINQAVPETSFQMGSYSIRSSEIQKPSEDDYLKSPPLSSTNHMPDFLPEPKNIMTCDELERFLLTNSVPPGFAKQDTTVDTTSSAQDAREAPVQQSSGSFNFFLDLYDDLGFDPFSESSKALADMLEEEKTSSRH